jgi:hypothetical protein
MFGAGWGVRLDGDLRILLEMRAPGPFPFLSFSSLPLVHYLNRLETKTGSITGKLMTDFSSFSVQSRRGCCRRCLNLFPVLEAASRWIHPQLRV